MILVWFMFAIAIIFLIVGYILKDKTALIVGHIWLVGSILATESTKLLEIMAIMP